MKTILFLGRTGTAHQYALMAPNMKDVNLVFVAFSQKAVDVWASFQITPDYIYSDLFKKEYDSCIVNDDILSAIDNDIIKQSNGRFNLNGSIQSDRGFSLLSYDECLRSSVAHYNVWKRIFSEHHVDLMIHEPCSLFFNHIGSILCKKQGGVYTYQIAALSDKYEYAYLNANYDSYDFLEIRQNYKKYLNDKSLIDRDRCVKFLNKFREDHNVFFSSLIHKKQPIFKLFWDGLKNNISHKLNGAKLDKRYQNIDYFLSAYNRPWEKIKNLIGYKREHIKYVKDIPKGEKFLFYTFHLEPEAVVLYLGDGIYKNQTKLIENIAASLPPDFYLYVKDHPHEYAYRDAIDYKRLMKVPNVRLLDRSFPAKAIIAQSEGVVALNGTAGFEGLLMGKHVYCFGHNMYSFMSRVHYVHNIRDMRSIVYDSINQQYTDDDDLMAYVMAYLESCHPGYTKCYVGGPQLENFDHDSNAKLLAEDAIKYVEICQNER